MKKRSYVFILSLLVVTVWLVVVAGTTVDNIAAPVAAGAESGIIAASIDDRIVGLAHRVDVTAAANDKG